MEGTTESRQETPKKTTFNVWAGVALVAHITGYILGPLVVLGGIGLWLDKTFNGHRIIFISSVLLAFVVANYLVYKKAIEITKRYK